MCLAWLSHLLAVPRKAEGSSGVEFFPLLQEKRDEEEEKEREIAREKKKGRALGDGEVMWGGKGGMEQELDF